MVKHKHVLEYGTTVVYTMEGEAGGGRGGGAGEWATQLGGMEDGYRTVLWASRITVPRERREATAIIDRHNAARTIALVHLPHQAG